jgi:hypothetical protein
MEVTVDRDSVAAGDDLESHERTFDVDARRKFVLFLRELQRESYLAQIQGGRATWVVRDRRGGRALAVLAQQWRAPVCFLEPSVELGAVGSRFHIEYVGQEDPLDVIEQVRPPSATGSDASGHRQGF